MIAGDTNRLNLEPILSLSHSLVQCVKVPTRLNPDRILDPIITTMSKYYAEPETKPPINPDDNSNGKPSDHLVVMMRPVSATYEVPPRVYRTVHTRPYTESGVAAFKQWIESESCGWGSIYTCGDSHKKAQLFQESLTQAYEECFPIKSFKISDDDCPWMTKSLKKLDRLRKREFYKNKKSSKWERLNLAFQTKAKDEKEKILCKYGL